MGLQDLQGVLQAQADKDGSITVSGATLTSANLTPAPDFDKTIQSYLCLKGPLTVEVKTSIPPPSGNTLSVTGAASFLAVTGVTVHVMFTLEQDNTVDALIAAVLPPGVGLQHQFPVAYRCHCGFIASVKIKAHTANSA